MDNFIGGKFAAICQKIATSWSLSSFL